MKVLLREVRSGLFLQEAGKWTDQADLAMEFKGGCEAITFRCENGIRGVELLLTFGEPGFDISLPLEAPVADGATNEAQARL